MRPAENQRLAMELSIIILAAGQGTRMRSARPKVLQPMAGKPLLGYVVDCAQRIPASDICIVHGFGGNAVMAEFSGCGFRWAAQSEQKGTGHAVIQAMPGTPDGNRVIILFGDVPLLQPTSLLRLLATCENDDVAVLTVEMENPHGYGRIIRENGRVVRNVEEKDATAEQRKITEVNTGVLCCPADDLKNWLNRLSNENSQGEYYLTDVIEMAAQDGVRVHGVKTDNQEEVMGINDRKQLAEAERALQKTRVEALMAEGVGFADPARVDVRGTLKCGKDVFIDINAIFEGDVVLGDNTTIESNNLIRNSELGPGSLVHSNCHIEGAKTGCSCEIGPFARLRPGAELADNVKVGNFVEIKKSTIADGSKVNHLTYIGDAEVGKGVNVGAGTIVCNYDGVNKHKTIIRDGAFIGSGVELVAPVTVGKDSTIGAGATITKDTPDGDLTIERAQQISLSNWQRPKKK